MGDSIKSIGLSIKEERKAQGLTQTELANLSGVSINFVSQLEQGKSTVQMDRVLMVLETLGLGLRVVYTKSEGS